RRLERADMRAGGGHVQTAQNSRIQGRIDLQVRIVEERQRLRDTPYQRLFERERLPDVAHLPGIVEQDDPQLAHDVDVLLDVEQQALVAAEHQAGIGILGADASNVEPADRIFAAEKDLLEDRQIPGIRVRMDVLGERAQ